MIFFHEGMPRSGKSYESLVKHIIPALAKGRAVDAYLYGLDHEKIAGLAGIELDRCKELLVELTTEQASECWKVCRDNALVVLDEAHKFWPSGRKRPPEEMCNLVAEHGHRGMDMLFMSQTFNSVHKVIQDRTNKKITFTKLDSVGMEKRYNWTAYQGTLGTRGSNTFVTFSKMDSGVGKYDEKFFGTYKSHVSEEIQTGNYKDERFNFFNKKSVKFGLPLVLLAFVGGIYYLSQFLSGSLFEGNKSEVETAKAAQPQQAPAGQAVQPVKPKRAEPDDYIYKSLKGRDYSLTYLSKFGSAVVDFWVEIRDEKGETLEVWQKADFDNFGYKYSLTSTGMIIASIKGTELLFKEKRLPNYSPNKKNDNIDMSATNPL
ncbi:TPA: zonular occludens toxin domain-containing protein [Aeromonas hydrophila]|uniref:zonular occludens toxin domain-containing protein n=1 Tax=Aeromonas hydrophila TaxID=644 RepID=UPI0021E7B14A|nr:zonular occludens toxin domain-containing protein [Aeromonas hydrophila]MCV3295452.1 zonular occludens toxin domain-containing protein [Aeromonas hydrophila]